MTLNEQQGPGGGRSTSAVGQTAGFTRETEAVHCDQKKIRGESSDKTCLWRCLCASAWGESCCNAAADQLNLINATAGLRPSAREQR